MTRRLNICLCGSRSKTGLEIVWDGSEGDPLDRFLDTWRDVGWVKGFMRMSLKMLCFKIKNKNKTGKLTVSFSPTLAGLKDECLTWLPKCPRLDFGVFAKISGRISIFESGLPTEMSTYSRTGSISKFKSNTTNKETIFRFFVIEKNKNLWRRIY